MSPLPMGLSNLLKFREDAPTRLGKAIHEGDTQAVEQLMQKGIKPLFSQTQLDERGIDVIPYRMLNDPYEILKISPIPQADKAKMWEVLAQHAPPQPQQTQSVPRLR